MATLMICPSSSWSPAARLFMTAICSFFQAELVRAARASTDSPACAFTKRIRCSLIPARSDADRGLKLWATEWNRACRVSNCLVGAKPTT